MIDVEIERIDRHSKKFSPTMNMMDLWKKIYKKEISHTKNVITGKNNEINHDKKTPHNMRLQNIANRSNEAVLNSFNSYTTPKKMKSHRLESKEFKQFDSAFSNLIDTCRVVTEKSHNQSRYNGSGIMKPHNESTMSSRKSKYHRDMLEMIKINMKHRQDKVHKGEYFN